MNIHPCKLTKINISDKEFWLSVHPCGFLLFICVVVVEKNMVERNGKNEVFFEFI